MTASIYHYTLTGTVKCDETGKDIRVWESTGDYTYIEQSIAYHKREFSGVKLYVKSYNLLTEATTISKVK